MSDKQAETAPVRAADLKFDPNNANLGTDRGQSLLKESIKSCGFGRSIVVDKHGVAIAGNKTLKAAVEAGAEIEIVQTTGDEVVVVQRTDLDLVAQHKARKLAYYDNRVQEIDLQWSPETLKQDMLAGVDVGVAFFPDELDDMTAHLDDLGAGTIADLPTGTHHATTNEHLSDPSEPFADSVIVDAFTKEKKPKEPKAPAFKHINLVFEGVGPQLRWSSLQRLLKLRYPDLKTQGARFCAFLNETEGL